jgi:hypothetical protein
MAVTPTLKRYCQVSLRDKIEPAGKLDAARVGAPEKSEMCRRDLGFSLCLDQQEVLDLMGAFKCTGQF